MNSSFTANTVTGLSVKNMVMKSMDYATIVSKKQQDKNLDDVMKFLIPHIRYAAFLMLKKDKNTLNSLQLRIKEGTKSDSVISFNHKQKNLDIDIKALEKEKGKEWVSLLKKQLTHLSETFSKV
jgi:hypothetical protein